MREQESRRAGEQKIRTWRTRCLFFISCSLALLLSCSFPGCGPKNFTNDNDRLRAENLELKRQVEDLARQAELREAELAAARQQAEGGVTPLPGAEPVRLAKITLERLSSAVDNDNDGNDDLARLYLKTLDGKGRFTPVSAKVNVQIVTSKPESDPQLIAEKTFEPAGFDAAYRSGLTGTHYTLELPLPADLPDGAADATARITLTEALTGVEHTTQAPLAIKHK